MTIEIRLVDNRLLALAGKLRARAGQVVRKTATDVEAGARARSRVDTGAMKDGWQTKLESDLLAVVYNNVEYTIYHELGTRKMAAQAMATPAAEAARPGFLAAMQQVLS